MTSFLRTLLATACVLTATSALAEVTFYEHESFEGRSFSTQRRVVDFSRHGFNDRASSVIVSNDRWEVCSDAQFGGRCVVLRPGRYATLASLGLNDRVSSVRAIDRRTAVSDNRYAPGEPESYYDARRRNNERLFQADVTSVRAVLGPVERRCWIEREAVGRERGDANVPGAVVGAVIGGILGHQVGGGSGRDIATVGGAVTGAAVGSNAGRGSGSRMHDVQRCEDVASSGAPQYWDVSYRFRGIDHRMQMRQQPGATVTVNRRGEPRG